MTICVIRFSSAFICGSKNYGLTVKTFTNGASIQPDKSKIIKNSLASADIHNKWENVFRSEDNEKFAEKLFGRVLRHIDLPPGSHFLDAGCGSGYNSLRLAQRGFKVTAADFSPPVLENARALISRHNLQESITVEPADLLGLPFKDDFFDGALLYGVLMHVPEIETAVSEICRVVKPGGYLIVSEINLHSLEASLLRFLKRLLKPGRTVKRTPAGLENWVVADGKPLIVRWTDMRWLIRNFRDNGAGLPRRLAGQFSEAYTFLPGNFLKKTVHLKNEFYFNYLRFPALAFGNVLIFLKGG